MAELDGEPLSAHPVRMAAVSKELLSAAAVGLTVGMFVPYISAIRRGHAKPHVFSWVVWALGTFIVFFAQLAAQGGVGAWPIGISALITSYIAVLAYRKCGDIVVTRTDWGFFIAALSALPCWFFTSDPLWAVVTLTVVDLIGFGPTVRKAFFRPQDESVLLFTLSAVRNLLVVLAMEQSSLATVLFPAAVGGACLLLAGLLVGRRRALAGQCPAGNAV